MKLKEAFVHFK